MKMKTETYYLNFFITVKSGSRFLGKDLEAIIFPGGELFVLVSLKTLWLESPNRVYIKLKQTLIVRDIYQSFISNSADSAVSSDQISL